jgi:hypothetical protein
LLEGDFRLWAPQLPTTGRQAIIREPYIFEDGLTAVRLHPEIPRQPLIVSLATISLRTESTGGSGGITLKAGACVYFRGEAVIMRQTAVIEARRKAARDIFTFDSTPTLGRGYRFYLRKDARPALR